MPPGHRILTCRCGFSSFTSRAYRTNPPSIGSATQAITSRQYTSSNKHNFNSSFNSKINPRTDPARYPSSFLHSFRMSTTNPRPIPSTTAPAAAPALSAIESAKAAAATLAVAEHFSPTFKYVGIGSGTTVVHVVAAIARTLSTSNTPLSSISFVPTGSQSRSVITSAGLTPLPFDALPENTLLDVCFDGADEVDDDLNCIKGGGACLYQEKLVATHSRKFVCVADHRKLQGRLLTVWKGVPVEVQPLAVRSVTRALTGLGCVVPRLRVVPGEGGTPVPVVTDQGFCLIDAEFKTLVIEKDLNASVKGTGEDGVWEVNRLAKEIKQIEGVLSVGIFGGLNGEEMLASGATIGGARPVIAYFGMADGSVTKRVAGQA